VRSFGERSRSKGVTWTDCAGDRVDVELFYFVHIALTRGPLAGAIANLPENYGSRAAGEARIERSTNAPRDIRDAVERLEPDQRTSLNSHCSRYDIVRSTLRLFIPSAVGTRSAHEEATGSAHISTRSSVVDPLLVYPSDTLFSMKNSVHEIDTVLR
jgi:hypothetical protein